MTEQINSNHKVCIHKFVHLPPRLGDSNKWDFCFTGAHLMGQICCIFISYDDQDSTSNKANSFLLLLAIKADYTYQFQHVPREEGVKGCEFKALGHESEDGPGHGVPDVGPPGHAVDEIN